MIPPTFILAARSSDDQTIKLIIGAVVLVFWGLGSIISAMNKRAEENKRRQRYQQLPEEFSAPVPPPVPLAAPARVKPGKRAAAKQRQATAAPRPAPVETFNKAAATPAPTPAPRQAKTATATPSQIGRLLRRQDSLRAAFILNEVLSPPLSIRKDTPGGASAH